MDAAEILTWFTAHYRKHPVPSQWTVGITDDPARRKQEHGHPPLWLALPANSKATAEAAERHLIRMGM
jgi:hypothetical protein